MGKRARAYPHRHRYEMGSIKEGQDTETSVGPWNTNPPGGTNILILFMIILTTTPQIRAPPTETSPGKIPSWVIEQGSTLENNLWYKLAKQANTDTVCLSTSNVANPFATCLVGIPLNESVQHFYKTYSVMKDNPVEFELLGTAITNFCMTFQTRPGIHRQETNVNPRKDIYRNITLWCNGTKQMSAVNTGITDKPLKLASGDFLICGERAWSGIPANPKGGPCTIGKVTLFHLFKFSIPGEIRSSTINFTHSGRNKRQIATSSQAEIKRRLKEAYPPRWDSYPYPPGQSKETSKETPFINFQSQLEPQNQPVLKLSPINKPATPSPFLPSKYLPPVGPDCDPQIYLWSDVKDFWVSFFLAGIATDHALGVLSHLTCWLTKEANVTSTALADLLEDSQTLKGISLHN
ncbi:hypothetical protein BTVI_41592 [Pitangus sulphuratus]|nr:hypothetical protein BTVI_41592 [Pitangus sulphuratus]